MQNLDYKVTIGGKESVSVVKGANIATGANLKSKADGADMCK